MIKKSIEISCPNGIEPRPIAELVQVASKYESKVYLETETKRVNAKSIMGVMVLASQDSAKIKIYADGEDEEEAVKTIAKLLA